MKNVTVFFLLLLSWSIYGQKSDCIFDPMNPVLSNMALSVEDGWIKMAPVLLTPEDLFDNTESLFDLPSRNEMTIVSDRIAEIGKKELRSVKFQQQYEDVPAECGIIIAHWEDCFLTSINGSFNCDYDFDTKSIISREDAIDSALEAIPSNEYMWNNPTQEALLVQEEGEGKTFYPDPVLMINCNDQLVYRMNIQSYEPYFSKRVDVDARSGEVVDERDNKIECFAKHGANESTGCMHEHGAAKNKDVTETKELKENEPVPELVVNTTTGSTLFNGIQTLKTKWSWGKYRLKDEVYGPKVETRDAEGSILEKSFGDCEEMTLSGSSNTVWSPADVRTTSVHWSVTKCKEYFFHEHNNSVGAGKKLKVKANFGVTACLGLDEAVAAHYDRNEQSLNLGGVAGVGYFGVLDIVGHEYAHFAIDVWGWLNYVNESGALNESFADIFGYMIDRRENGATDWNLGERSGAIIRNLEDPSSIPLFACGPTGLTQPDTYLGPNWFTGSGDNGGVHINSGVQNKWFSLLSEGGVHNGITVQGISQESAAAIAFHNLVHFITPNSNYLASRNGSVEAARILFGECSFEHIQTQLAWEACGIGFLEGCIQVQVSDHPWWPISYLPVQICSNDSNLPISISLTGYGNGDVVWTPVNPGSFIPGKSTEGWDWSTSGMDNEVLTINSVNNSSPSFYYMKFVSEEKVGLIMFLVVDCPNLTDPNDPSEDFECTEIIPRAKSTENHKVEISNLVIIPNPAKNYISINLEHINGNYDFEIINDLGTVHIQGNTTNQKKIDISRLTSGSYTIQVNYLNQHFVSKFIKI